MVEFYEWLKKNTKVTFTYPLYVITPYTSWHTDDSGFSFSLTKKKTDLRIKEINSEEYDKSHIQDGGKLKPLNIDEQKDLIRALKEIGNTEMTLAFLIAMKTGARTLTVFTLKADILKDHDLDDTDEVPVTIGRGSNTSNKNDKRMVIYLPGWLHNRMRTYYNSPRAINRRKLNSSIKSTDQFIFLTRDGNPYYIGQKDDSYSKYSNPPTGRSMRKFIADQLHPQLEKMGSKLRLSFHDLRATFGMNYVRHGVNRMDLGQISKSSLLNNLRTLMGHSSIRTTLLYLEYDFADKFDYKIQEEWELSLINGEDF